MSRVIYLEGDYDNEDKFKFKKEYEGFDIYQEICPSGFSVSNSWFINGGSTETRIRFYSYSNITFTELLNLIDKYNETGRYGLKAYLHDDSVLGKVIYYVHDSGKEV